MISYNNSAPKSVNNVGQFGATEGSIGAYKSAAEYAADAKYWALLSQTRYSSIDDILAEVERLYAQGLLLESDIQQLKNDFEEQNQTLLGLIQSTEAAIDNTNSATELAKEATQEVLAQLDIISNMTVQTSLLPPGSLATGSYDNTTGVFSFGIPEGQPGRDGTNGTISDIGDVAIGVPVSDDYGFYVDKDSGGLYRTSMVDIANLVPSIRSISINGGEEQTGAVSFNSVSSFNNRTGDVVAQTGDYEVGQITGAAKSGANSDITSLSGLTTALSISQGGTGASTPEASRTNLGLGSVSVEDIVPLSKGGTGATTPSAARTNLGLGLVSTESIVPIIKGGTGSTSAETARLALVAAKSGDNYDITSINNLTTALSVEQGGTGVNNQSDLWGAVRPNGPTPLFADPVNANDAATKGYVDTTTGSISTNLDSLTNVVNDVYDREVNTLTQLLSLVDVNAGDVVAMHGYYSAGDGGGSKWVRDNTISDGIYTGSPIRLGNRIVVYSTEGKAYRMVLSNEIDLRQLGAQDNTLIDTHFKLAADLCVNNASVNKIIIYGKYNHNNPLVIPPGVFVDYVDPRYSYTKKLTNNTSGLPALTGSYGGNLVMDVDACIILDHGYGHRLDNFNIKCAAPNSVSHGIYHGFTRETDIAQNVSRIGESGTDLTHKPVNGITAQQGFVHSYGYVMSFTTNCAWNYILNTAGTGCNLVHIKQSWNYDASGTAIKFQASTNISLGQQYCEGTKRRIYEFTGVTGATIDVLSIDNHVANSAADSVLYTRNSQLVIGCLTVNALSVPEGQANTMFIQHTVGEGIYGCLTINGITARTVQRNTPRLITITKDAGSSGNNCVIRGMPIPSIGALGNVAATDAGSVSHELNTGRATTPHFRGVTCSFESQAVGDRSHVMNSFCSYAATEGSTVLSSTLTRSAESFEVCGGYNGVATGDPQTSNRKWSLNSQYGTIRAAGAITNGYVFADYAEYFENYTVGVIPFGTLVDLIGDKIVPATGDEFVGVVSATAGVVLNAASLGWQGQYVLGEYGEPLYEVVDGVEVQVVNDNFDPSLPYVPRESRPEEWSCVGLMGQLYVNVDDTVGVGDYLEAVNGVGCKASGRTRLRVMSITSSGIARCILR